MHSDPDAARPRVRPHPTRTGVQIVDPIQDAQFTLLTPDSADISPCDTDRFYFPADAAVTLSTDTVETPYPVGAWVRDADGDTVAEVDVDTGAALPPARYNVELMTTQIKVQFALDGALRVEAVDDRIRFDVEGADGIHLGVRSEHEQPAATVTTTDDPDDVMRAVSLLGSALKTTSCERSFPTLRGHPPLIERGDEFTAPDWLTAPDTGVRIQVPPSLAWIYPVAPLAYYLGAAVEPGPRPRLVADDWTYALDGPDGFEATVARVLKQVFLLDCVTRTEGYYEIDLHERHLVEDQVDLDFAALYDRPLAEQVHTYLDVPHDALAEAMPTWKLTADVRPRAEYVSALPFLADELAVVRCPGETALDDKGEDAVVEQVRAIVGDGGTRGDGAYLRGEARPTRSNVSQSSVDETIFRPADADSIEQAYVGEGIPVGASKMTVDAYYRRLEYEPSSEPQIRVVVVCNDEQMADENVVSEIYGAREWIEFDITFREAVTTDEMRGVLESNVDFLHYIGHVDPEGIRCADGYLDTTELEEVNVSAFLLNACDSYEQGYGLVDHGAMAGIATVTDVVNEAATSAGQTIARLLNQGFSLAATMSLVRDHEQIGHHYIVVGDASMSVVKNESGTPYIVQVQEYDEDRYLMSLFGYPRLDSQIGSFFLPFVTGNDGHYLNSGVMGAYELEKDELSEYINQQKSPVTFGDSLFWSDGFLVDN